jgi:hypothetical protein
LPSRHPVLPLCLALGAVASAPARGAADDDTPTRFERIGQAFRSVPDDLGGIARYPVDHWRETRNGLLLVGALVAADKPLTRYWQDHIETSLDGFQLPRSPLHSITNGHAAGEDGWLLAGVGATYLYGFALDDGKAQETGIRATKAVTYSYVVSQLLLKSLTGRRRPLDSLSDGQPDGIRTRNPYDFGHVHAPQWNSDARDSSMPSFHFTMFFSVATVYSRMNDDAWWPYGLAAVGLASNVRGHHHWVSDMVAGALVGTAIGRVVTQSAVDDERLAITPFVEPGGTGIRVSYRF